MFSRFIFLKYLFTPIAEDNSLIINKSFAHINTVLNFQTI